MANLGSLSAEIMALIVSQLDERKDLYNCIKSQRQLRDAATPLLWKTIKLQQPGRGLKFLYCLRHVDESVREHIQYVHLQDLPWNDRTLGILKRYTPRLTTLILDNARRITDTSLENIDEVWPRLQSLHLVSSSITDISYFAMGRLEHLTQLHLINCRELHPMTLSNYFKNSPLTHLTLEPFITAGLDLWTNKTIDLSSLCHLVYLNVHGAPFALQNHTSPLRSVNMEACFELADNDAIRLVESLPAGLTDLTIMDGKFTNATLETIATRQPNLLTLDVSFNNKITPRGVRRLVNRCPQLEWLKLDYCGFEIYDISEAGPECSGTVALGTHTFTELHHLDSNAMNRIRFGPDLGAQDENDKI